MPRSPYSKDLQSSDRPHNSCPRSRWEEDEEEEKDFRRSRPGRRSRSPRPDDRETFEPRRRDRDNSYSYDSKSRDNGRDRSRRSREEERSERRNDRNYHGSRRRDSSRSRSPHYHNQRRERRNSNPPKLQRRESDSKEDEYRVQRQSKQKQNGDDDDEGGSGDKHLTLRKNKEKSYSSSSKSIEKQKQDFQPEAKPGGDHQSEEDESKDLPNFNQSGKLAAETNSFKGVVLKYHEPPEARKPNKKFRLYVFKGSEQIDLLHIYQQSAYLFGRDRVVVDVPIDHPSSSKQHAVIQYRQIHTKNEFGDAKTLVKPFLIDLESANGSFVNGEKVPESRYFELKDGDVIKFGFSTREFVLIPEQ